LIVGVLDYSNQVMDIRLGIDMKIAYDVDQINWNNLKIHVRQHWSKLTEDDISQLSRGNEDLVDLLRKRYGYGKAQAQIEINNWLEDGNIKARE
jgi:protein-arginine kinase